ncbi:MAG: DUF4115 domain-containing protein [Rhodoferax sp.]|uniref:helix-turn-helix domain-containing protein n=1 Tax=Rhodoferax sp. TaxID=50421 RepID=UPI00261CAE66|nr:helix-turn-helix domain-containing protein [Rhodoferax sp.]MDD5335755.1 DUF4115 domain-containing protein [Rhodoferax sp.]
MSEPVLPSAEEQLPTPQPMTQVTGGAMLRLAREALGLHIAALAVSLKVPVKKLEALEADRFDLLPDAVFVRALASSVCRSLKIDPEPVLAKMPHTSAPQLRAYEASINIPFRSPAGRGGMFSWDHLSRPFVWVVLGLLTGALVLFFFPVGQRIEVAVAPKTDAASVNPPLPLPAPAPTANEEKALPAAAPAAEAVNASAVLVPGSGATSGVVVFKARAVSWIEVVDASGVVQVRRNMASGETIGATGALPLAVVVGRADTTEVQVRGKPFDLIAIAKDNVARFEVN